MNMNCNLTTCRYYKDGKCTSENDREECIRVAKLVLGEDIGEVPHYDETTCAYWCPRCMRSTVLDMSEPSLKRKRCEKCGQLINWKEIDRKEEIGNFKGKIEM